MELDKLPVFNDESLNLEIKKLFNRKVHWRKDQRGILNRCIQYAKSQNLDRVILEKDFPDPEFKDIKIILPRLFPQEPSPDDFFSQKERLGDHKAFDVGIVLSKMTQRLEYLSDGSSLEDVQGAVLLARVLIDKKRSVLFELYIPYLVPGSRPRIRATFLQSTLVRDLHSEIVEFLA